MEYTHKRPSRPRGEAVFRGRDGVYTFRIFTLQSVISSAASVFLITRRTVDRFGRGHQQLLCIGHGADLARQLKRHRKCFRKLGANSICLLAEADDTKREKIVSDLCSARSLECLVDENARVKREMYRNELTPPTRHLAPVARAPRTLKKAA